LAITGRISGRSLSQYPCDEDALSLDLHAQRWLDKLAMLLAALGMFGTGTGWPNLAVAAIMATLALQGSVVVARQALADRRTVPA
jgi:hypothetical protein